MNYENSKVIAVDIEKEMRQAYLDYSMSVIVGRALPDVRDGLKPVHRRILYTMFENGLYPERGFRKCADTVGSVLGKYHPHGDASVYDALVRMAQDFSLRYPLVKGQGNFGSVDGDPPAAYRYTEAKMSKSAMLMLRDIDKETVDFMPNYDDRHKEPTVLPSKFPNLLVNGSTGIAVGMATNMPPHNLGEVIDAVDMLIDNPEATMDELMEHIKGPDFPTGGIIMGRSGMRAAYATGRGRVIVRARAEVETQKNGREHIIITEIPYMVNKSRMVENIADLVKDKRIDQISNIRDESNRNGIKVVIELKRDANAQVVLNQLYSYSQMQTTFGIINLAIVNGEPKELTLKQLLEEYVKFQIQIITRRTQFELKKAQEREHILEGLKIALDYIDEVINLIRSSKDANEAKASLIERFELTEIQANAIAQMRLIQLSGLERKKIEDELGELCAKIEEYKDILSDENRVTQIIKQELADIKEKNNEPRRTEIQAVSGEVDIEDLIPEEDCVVTLTHYGYIKRQPVDVYKRQHRGGRGVSGMTRREEDFVEELFICSTHDYIMFFSNKGKVYRLKGYEIGESSRAARGANVINLLPLEQDEKISAMIKVRDLEDSDKYLVMVTNQGIIKRTALSQYKNVRKNGLIAINLDENDELAWVRLTDGESNLTVATANGMSITFNENDARPLGRTARGVKAITLGEDDIVIGMCVMDDESHILTVSESGLGRRTAPEEYRTQTRGGKGLRNYYVDKNGPVAGIRSIKDGEDVIIITDDGVIIRIPSEQISVQSRYAGGVKVMRLDDESKVVTLAVAPNEDVSEGEEDEETEGQEAREQNEQIVDQEAAPMPIETDKENGGEEE